MASSPDSSPPLVVCAGVAVIDNIYRVDEFPKAGTKTRAADFLQILGGCAANAAVAVARLGGRARLAAPLGGPAGHDLTGDSILLHLAREHVDTSGVIRIDGAPSSLSSILIDREGERLIVNYRHPGLGGARIADPARLLRGARALSFDNRYPQFVLPLACAARERGMIVVLDGDQPTTLTDELLAAATHVVFSADGLRATARIDDLEAALRGIASHTGAFLAVTDGGDDMVWLEGKSARRRPAFRVEAVDTLGAGDVFHGAFALALAEGRPDAGALRFAAATAALKCTRFGGGTGAPGRAEVENFLTARGE
jgi:sugar/nucleoside kinase (ribokinase family)